MYVSVGHKVDLRSAERIVLDCAIGHLTRSSSNESSVDAKVIESPKVKEARDDANHAEVSAEGAKIIRAQSLDLLAGVVTHERPDR